MINFGQIYCIMKQNELKYIIEKAWLGIFLSEAFRTVKNFLYKMEDFYNVSKSCY